MRGLLYRRASARLIEEGLLELVLPTPGKILVDPGQKIARGDSLAKLPDPEEGLTVRPTPESSTWKSPLAGVVEGVARDRSLLLKLSFLSVPVRLVTPGEVWGELQWWEVGKEEKDKGWAGKLLVYRESVPVEAILKAQALGAVGALVGGLSYSSLENFRTKGLTLGVFEGLGPHSLSSDSSALLKKLTGHWVLLSGSRGELILPNPSASLVKETLSERRGLVEVKVGDSLVIFRGTGSFQEGVLTSWQEEESRVSLKVNGKEISADLRNVRLS